MQPLGKCTVFIDATDNAQPAFDFIKLSRRKMAELGIAFLPSQIFRWRLLIISAPHWLEANLTESCSVVLHVESLPFHHESALPLKGSRPLVSGVVHSGECPALASLRALQFASGVYPWSRSPGELLCLFRRSKGALTIILRQQWQSKASLVMEGGPPCRKHDVAEIYCQHAHTFPKTDFCPISAPTAAHSCCSAGQ
jgi:hypothetical protein